MSGRNWSILEIFLRFTHHNKIHKLVTFSVLTGQGSYHRISSTFPSNICLHFAIFRQICLQCSVLLVKFDVIFTIQMTRSPDHRKKIHTWILLDLKTKSRHFYDQKFMSFRHRPPQENTKMDWPMLKIVTVFTSSQWTSRLLPLQENTKMGKAWHMAWHPNRPTILSQNLSQNAANCCRWDSGILELLSKVTI